MSEHGVRPARVWRVFWWCVKAAATAAAVSLMVMLVLIHNSFLVLLVFLKLAVNVYLFLMKL